MYLNVLILRNDSRPRLKVFSVMIWHDYGEIGFTWTTWCPSNLERNVSFFLKTLLFLSVSKCKHVNTKKVLCGYMVWVLLVSRNKVVVQYI